MAHGPDVTSKPLSHQQRGRIGGLTRAALAPDRKAITKGARDGRWQRYVDRVREVLPELAADDPELIRRAEALRRADMIKMSAAAAAKRAELRALEAELDASGLLDAGSDGVDL